eukprot:30761-Pelagococcus_subviridis.AAC.1
MGTSVTRTRLRRARRASRPAPASTSRTRRPTSQPPSSPRPSRARCRSRASSSVRPRWRRVDGRGVLARRQTCVGGGVERRRGIDESADGRRAERDARAPGEKGKSSRNDVHNADAVVGTSVVTQRTNAPQQLRRRLDALPMLRLQISLRALQSHLRRRVRGVRLLQRLRQLLQRHPRRGMRPRVAQRLRHRAVLRAHRGHRRVRRLMRLKGVRSGVERRRGGRVGIETVAWWAESDDRNAGKKRKSSRSGVHHADAVVGDQCDEMTSRTRLNLADDRVV